MPDSYGSACALMVGRALGPSSEFAKANSVPMAPPRIRKTSAGRYERSTTPPLIAPPCARLLLSARRHEMNGVVVAAAWIAAALNVVAAGWGGLCWRRFRHSA